MDLGDPAGECATHKAQWMDAMGSLLVLGTHAQTRRFEDDDESIRMWAVETTPRSLKDDGTLYCIHERGLKTPLESLSLYSVESTPSGLPFGMSDGDPRYVFKGFKCNLTGLWKMVINVYKDGSWNLVQTHKALGWEVLQNFQVKNQAWREKKVNLGTDRLVFCTRLEPVVRTPRGPPFQ